MNESCRECGYPLNVFGCCLRCDGATVDSKKTAPSDKDNIDSYVKKSEKRQ